MAESDDKPVKARRRLRAPSETVREKAEKAREVAAQPKERGAVGSFFYGLSWPLRKLWQGLVWISHRPPLKQIGHGLRWFFTRKPMRFLGRILGLKYLASSFREIKLVTWPSWMQSVRLTSAVIIFSIVFGALIAAVDYGLDKIFKHIILK